MQRDATLKRKNIAPGNRPGSPVSRAELRPFCEANPNPNLPSNRPQTSTTSLTISANKNQINIVAATISSIGFGWHIFVSAPNPPQKLPASLQSRYNILGLIH